jgi:DNA modification methylase
MVDELSDLPQPDFEGTVATDALDTDGDNPNEMTDEQFSLLCDRMQDNGWLGGPIITNTDGLIADGEHRWRAAKEIGLAEVPVKQYEITDSTRRLWRQELNKIHGEHDTKRDALEYDHLLGEGFTEEVEALTDAADEDLDELLAELRMEGGQSPAYEYDPEHNVHFEDCVEGMRERLADDSVDCVITDPPYGMSFQSGRKTETTEEGDRVKSWPEIEGDETIEDAVELLKDTLGQVVRVLKEGGHAYIFCDWRGIHEIKPLVQDVLNVKNVLVWDKGSMGIGDLENNWGYSHEFIIFATNGDRASPLSEATRNVLEHGRPNRTDYEHPTMKPESLLVELVQVSSQPGDTVLDPFMGSGTTAVAAIQNDREYVGFEVDAENYRDVIERRIGEAKRQKDASVNREEAAND